MTEGASYDFQYGEKWLVAGKVLPVLEKWLESHPDQSLPFSESDIFGPILEHALKPWLYEDGNKVLDRVRPEPLPGEPVSDAYRARMHDKGVGDTRRQAKALRLVKLRTQDPDLFDDLVQGMRKILSEKSSVARDLRFEVAYHISFDDGNPLNLNARKQADGTWKDFPSLHTHKNLDAFFGVDTRKESKNWARHKAAKDLMKFQKQWAMKAAEFWPK